jgi:hypothetical protein
MMLYNAGLWRNGDVWSETPGSCQLPRQSDVLDYSLGSLELGMLYVNAWAILAANSFATNRLGLNPRSGLGFIPRVRHLHL